MAKRHKDKDETEEELDFKLPKFDEEKFVKKEKEKIKATFVSFIFGLFVAVITFGFWVLLADSPFQWMLTFLFGLFTAAWLRYIFIRIKIKEEILEKKGMFTTYAVYFLTWLFVLIILVNPPFYDNDAPTIQHVALPDMQEIEGTVKIIAHVADNSRIKNDEASFILSYNNSIIDQKTMALDGNIFSYEFTNPNQDLGTFSYTITAEDTNGKKTEVNGSFVYDNDVIKIPEPTGTETYPGPYITYARDIKIDVKATVDWVYYTVDGTIINVTEIQSNYYITNPSYEGWEKNSQPTIKVFAKKIHYFENIPTAFNNTIVDTTTYYFNVSDDSEIGSIEDSIPTLPQPKMISVPGFEAFIALISLGAAVLIFKYKKKHNSS
jgi:PGF-CTERM motif protein